MIPGDINIKKDILDPGITRMILGPSQKNIKKTINMIKKQMNILVIKIIDKDPEKISMIVEMIEIEMTGIVEAIEMTDKKEEIVEIDIIGMTKSILRSKLLNMSKKFWIKKIPFFNKEGKYKK
jgi:hypothetical protein